MPLAPLDPFVGVKAAATSCVGDWHRLAIDNERAGLGRVVGFFACLPARYVKQMPDQLSLSPSSKIVVDRLPRRKSAGQHPLLTSRFDQVENGVQNAAPEVVTAPPVGVEKRSDLLPLGVRQVGAIAFAHSFGVVFEE